METREEEREEREDQVEERREWRGVSTRFFFFELGTLIGVEGREALAEFSVGLADVGVLGWGVATPFLLTVGVPGRERTTGGFLSECDEMRFSLSFLDDDLGVPRDFLACDEQR